jgi:hypothetical protein
MFEFVCSRGAPPGWPRSVPPPGAAEWQARVVAWLWDLVPVEYRRYQVLSRYPVLLARLASAQVSACRVAARQGLATARADLRGAPTGGTGVPADVPPEAVEALLNAYERELSRLAETARAVDLVAQALAGRVFVPRL